MIPQISIIGVSSISEINIGDDLASLIYDAARAQSTPLHVNNVAVVTQKIASKPKELLLPSERLSLLSWLQNLLDRQ
jgi:F420-0:gamma-glutamyl ligase